MKSEDLPLLEKVLTKALSTFFKGVKISESGISIEKSFNPILVDKNNLEEYCKLFNFKTELPLTYLYLLAQRAQVACMLDKRFTISIPGLIHVENVLKSHNKINVEIPVELKSTVVVEYKKEGSLIPVFVVYFYQNDVLIAECKSIYIAKRKSTSKNQKSDFKYEFNSENNNKILLTRNDAKRYAKISGDKNPIHTSLLASKFFGLKSTIIHGWYLSSLAFSILENNIEKYNTYTCKFIKPVLLPQVISYSLNDYKLDIKSDDILFMKSELILS